MDANHLLFLENIKRIRKEKGMSQKDVAERSDMLVPTYSRLECGRANPSLGTMTRIANALEVSIVELLQPSEIQDPSIVQKLEKINSLSENNKSVVNIMIDSMIEKDKLEKSKGVIMKNRLKELENLRNINP